jgi:hypothetical protein
MYQGTLRECFIDRAVGSSPNEFAAEGEVRKLMIVRICKSKRLVSAIAGTR